MNDIFMILLVFMVVGGGIYFNVWYSKQKRAQKEKQSRNIMYETKRNRPKFVVDKSIDNKIFFTLAAENGECLLTSEMYNSVGACLNGIDAVRRCVLKAEITYNPKRVWTGDDRQKNLI